jgi:hypothetical protein
MGSLLPKKTSTSLRKNPVTASTSPRSVAANSSVIASALSFMSVSGISCLPRHDQWNRAAKLWMSRIVAA